MKELDVKKLIKLQADAEKLRDRIVQDVTKYNKLVCDQIRPLSNGILHNTIYEVDGVLYKRGRLICQLSCDDNGLGIKAEGLATLRKITVENEQNAAPKNEKRRQSTDVSE